MNRITSPHLPRARALVSKFLDGGLHGDTPQAQAARQRSPVGWAVARAALAAQLQDRLDGRSLPNQQGTSYCGCAAFLYCLLEDRPDWYVAYATALWNGEPFSFRSASNYLNVRIGETARDALADVQAGKTPAGNMNALDWMTMACLSAATSRSGDALTRVKPGEEFRAITWPFMVKRWFASVGAPARHDSVGMGAGLASLDDMLQLFALWDSCWLVMEIDASLLKGGSPNFTKRHWVVVDPETRPLIGQPGQSTGLTGAQFKAKLAINPFAGRMPNNAYGMEREAWQHVNKVQAEIDSSIIKLRVVSWADEHSRIHQPTLPFVLDRFHGGYAFPRFNRK